jgi:hypothetical protein
MPVTIVEIEHAERDEDIGRLATMLHGLRAERVTLQIINPGTPLAATRTHAKARLNGQMPKMLPAPEDARPRGKRQRPELAYYRADNGQMQIDVEASLRRHKITEARIVGGHWPIKSWQNALRKSITMRGNRFARGTGKHQTQMPKLRAARLPELVYARSASGPDHIDVAATLAKHGLTLDQVKTEKTTTRWRKRLKHAVNRNGGKRAAAAAPVA